MNQTPADLNRYRDLQKMVGIMQRRGFSETDIEAVLSRQLAAILWRSPSRVAESLSIAD